MRGYKEEGTTTTPFDMVVLNDLDRFHLVIDVIDRVPQLGAGRPTQAVLRDKLIEHKHYIRKYGDDMPEITDWKWGVMKTHRHRRKGGPRMKTSKSKAAKGETLWIAAGIPAQGLVIRNPQSNIPKHL